jgi:hypothetical protein
VSSLPSGHKLIYLLVDQYIHLVGSLDVPSSLYQLRWIVRLPLHYGHVRRCNNPRFHACHFHVLHEAGTNVTGWYMVSVTHTDVKAYYTDTILQF